MIPPGLPGGTDPERRRRPWRRTVMKKKDIPSTDPLGKSYPNWKIMCKSYGVSPPLFERRIRAGMALEAALVPSRNAMKPCTDHTGREFRSLSAMCAAWGVSPSTYYRRIKSGLTVEEALTRPCSGDPVSDHTGKTFPSVSAMCLFWGVDPTTYLHRVGRGMTIEQALTAPPRDTSVTDHTGSVFPSETAMCEAWGVPYRTCRARLSRGMDLEAALTMPIAAAPKAKPVKDHTGQEFRSQSAMCRAWNVTLRLYCERRKRGMSLEDALTAPVRASGGRKACADHTGREFPSQKAMCEAWGVRTDAYRHRLERGMTVEEALTGTGLRE